MIEVIMKFLLKKRIVEDVLNSKVNDMKKRHEGYGSIVRPPAG